jgi:hypothetical protein
MNFASRPGKRPDFAARSRFVCKRAGWTPALILACGMVALCLGLAVPAHSGTLELKDAVVITSPALTAREKKAVRLLVEEVEKRTQAKLPVMSAWPTSNVPVIAVGSQSALKEFAGPYAKELLAVRKTIGPEGYRLCVKRGARNPAVYVIGADERGVLSGVGGLLRELRLQPGSATLSDDLDIITVPRQPLSGIQPGGEHNEVRPIKPATSVPR